MSQGHRPLKDRMLSRLLLAKRWVTGAELAEGLSTSQPAIEDALADLVSEEMAEHQAGVGYRLRASQLCQEAMRDLQLQIRASEQKNKFRRVMKGQPFEGVYRFGIAEHRPREGLHMYELEVTLPDDGDDLNVRTAQLLAIANLSTQERAYG